jgi:L-ascorbate metabolism protein UlaG (beta-lactamase superfamily)
MGSLLDLEQGGARRLRIYISGDTTYHDELTEVVARYPDIDVALLHLGGTRLLGLVTVTMDGRQATRLVDVLDPRTVVPIHFDDYTVFRSPLGDFDAEMAKAGFASRLRHVRRGETASLDGADR